MPMRRKVANQTEARFKDKARGETFADSAVDGSLDRMAGNSQKTAGRHGKVRRAIAKRARNLSRVH